MKNQLYSYCTGVINNYCDVSLEQYDASNVLTTTNADSVKNVYTITLRKLRDGVSTSNILVAKTSTTSSVTIELPDSV